MFIILFLKFNDMKPANCFFLIQYELTILKPKQSNIGFPGQFEQKTIQVNTRLIQFRLKINAQVHQHSTVKKSHSISKLEHLLDK